MIKLHCSNELDNIDEIKNSINFFIYRLSKISKKRKIHYPRKFMLCGQIEELENSI